MRARPEIRPHLIAHRMKRWLDIARCPIMDVKVPTWRARRNYRAFVRKYPEIAERLGYSEALSFPSPLHDLRRPAVPHPQVSSQKFPVGSLDIDAADPAHESGGGGCVTE